MPLAILLFMLGRLREPSTYAGGAGIVAALAQMFPEYAGLMSGAGVFLGAIAVFVRDRSAAMAEKPASYGP